MEERTASLRKQSLNIDVECQVIRCQMSDVKFRMVESAENKKEDWVRAEKVDDLLRT